MPLSRLLCFWQRILGIYIVSVSCVRHREPLQHAVILVVIIIIIIMIIIITHWNVDDDWRLFGSVGCGTKIKKRWVSVCVYQRPGWPALQYTACNPPSSGRGEWPNSAASYFGVGVLAVAPEGGEGGKRCVYPRCFRPSIVVYDPPLLLLSIGPIRLNLPPRDVRGAAAHASVCQVHNTSFIYVFIYFIQQWRACLTTVYTLIDR